VPRRIHRAGLPLAVAALLCCLSLAAAGRDVAFTVQPLAAPEPIVGMQADKAGGLLAASVAGVLWRLDPATTEWRRVGDGIDPHTPLASGHGRIAARDALGGLRVWEAGRATILRGAQLAPHSGLLILPLGIIGVVEGPTGARVARFEPTSHGGWTETARSIDPVLPDARPLQVDLDGGKGEADGHIVVLAGPDDRRYRHGVLGDAIEATRVLYLERHGLTVLRSLEVPAPHVLEDIAPRPIAWRGRVGLATMRSGPQGAQLAIVAPGAGAGDRLEIAAVGPPIGMPNRWLAATTDGKHLLAVHTPHIGGALHAYQPDGNALSARKIADGVSNHRIGTRELDLAAWIGALLLLPAQDRTRLRCFDADAGFMACGSVPLGTPAIATAVVVLEGRTGVAALTADGRLTFVVASR